MHKTPCVSNHRGSNLMHCRCNQRALAPSYHRVIIYYTVRYIKISCPETPRKLVPSLRCPAPYTCSIGVVEAEDNNTTLQWCRRGFQRPAHRTPLSWPSPPLLCASIWHAPGHECARHTPRTASPATTKRLPAAATATLTSYPYRPRCTTRWTNYLRGVQRCGCWGGRLMTILIQRKQQQRQRQHQQPRAMR